MRVAQVIKKKRDGQEITKDEMEFLINSMVNGNIADCQLGALLMAIYIRGLSDRETINLTEAMILSGDRLQWDSEWHGLLVDKHSTGGVGDKISLILAPVMAACGFKVPMISGRSLEHTGGTLDKLESVPGFITDLNQEMVERALEYAGCCITGATSSLCPADKIMYRVRDVTSTVDSINLIVASIISKKVSSGAKFLVIDLKVGKAAFFKTVDDARVLAKQLELLPDFYKELLPDLYKISVSAKMGMSTRVILSHMDQPLGNTVGNALEVVEAVQCLSGNMDPAIASLIFVIGSNLLEMTNYKGDAHQMINKVIQEGSAMERFRRMLLIQGVNEKTVNQLLRGEVVLPTAKFTTQFKVHTSGWVSEVDAWVVGQVCLELGAGRRTGNEVIDPTVGVVVHKHVGDMVAEGDLWATVHHSSMPLPKETVEYLQRAVAVVETKVIKPDVVIEVIQ